MAVLLGLLVALTYGAADFLGGVSSKRSPATVVVAASQVSGLLVIAVIVAFVGEHDPIGADIVRGCATGAIGMVGILLLYRGLAIGSMSVVAPITAVGGATAPLVWGLITGERPGGWALVGVVLAITAVYLVAGGDEARGARRDEVVMAIGAGIAFGVVFILLDNVSEDAGMWPLLSARLTSVALLIVFLVARRIDPRPEPTTRLTTVGAGILDVTANALYVLAAREGLLSLVAVLSSLYPAATVVLAAAVLHERIGHRQRAGMALALAGVALIATG